MSKRKLPDNETLTKLYTQEKLTSEQIAKQYNTDKSAVVRLLNRIGVKLRPSGAKRKLPADNTVLDLYINDGLSCDQIAEKYRCSKAAVRSFLNRRRVKMRTNKDYDLVNWDREPTRFINKRNGYIMIYFPGAKQAIPEHRFVMEKKLGRKLEPNEVVHHLNAIKGDNRPQNLVVVTRPTHPLKDKDTYRGALQKRIRELEEEVIHLKNLLSQS